ncbi:MAG: hypothetical protein KAW67_01015 [Candidatus Eisenbacteria sp.]|nr:hypothetical protein [Candidatus Eisenbacteria bacterium]
MDHGVTATSEDLRIPFKVLANKVIFPVTVGDSRPLEIVLDTGSPLDGLLLYNSALLDSIELRNPMSARVGGAGSGAAQTAVMADSMSFRAGNVDFDGQRIVVLEGRALAGFPSDGVCGHSLFGSFVVELDYDRKMIFLHTPGEFSPDSTWTQLPITFKENTIPWVEVAVGVGDADSVAKSCYIDLASRETLEFLIRDGMKFELPENLEDVYTGARAERGHLRAGGRYRLGGAGAPQDGRCDGCVHARGDQVKATRR